MKQLSPEWFAAKRGCLGASRIADATARTKSGWGASRANIMSQLICERLTGESAPSFTTPAMQHGIDTEPQARDAYCFLNDVEVEEVGFIPHPTIEWTGASPDGVVGEGLIEIKCQNTATHIEYLLSGKIPLKYVKQMQWQMACTERQWCDYVAFDPRLPMELQMKVERVKRDEDMITQLEVYVADFITEMKEKLKQLRVMLD